MEPADDALKCRMIRGRREGTTKYVAVDIELFIFGPARMIDVQRGVGELPRQHRREVQAAPDHRL
jgi:hypothetical protein